MRRPVWTPRDDAWARLVAGAREGDTMPEGDQLSEGNLSGAGGAHPEEMTGVDDVDTVRINDVDTGGCGTDR
jgi:hypothetical protein